jgi:lyzozyme M1 (1,4-beta-N-acetylmuramidase)
LPGLLETESAAHSSYLLEGIYHFPQQIKGVTQTMKRLVSVFLVLCMMLSCVAFGETLDGAQGEIMNEVSDVASDEVQTPDEPTQAPVNEDDIVLPDMDDDISILPSDDVNGPDPYRELVLLQPTDLIGTTLSETSVRIGWGSVAFATQYDVYRKFGGETSYTLLGSVPNNRLYYEDTNVTPGQAVYYRVRAVNVSYDGEQAKYVYSPDSQTLSYMTLAKPKLQDPRGLGADTIRLNWSSVSGAQTYEVQMSTNATSGFTTVRTDLTGTLCNATGLKKATGYYFRVRAVRVFSSGEKFYSEYSNVGCGTPMDRPELTVVQSGNNALLSWPASSGATGYIIYRKTGASGSYTLLAKTGAVTSFVDASINLGEVYYYFIYSMRPVGSYNCFSLSSERVYFTALGSVNLCAVRNTGKQEQTIDWDTTVLGANKYYVYSSTTMDGLYTKIGETEGTTYVAKNLVAGTTYYYKVRPVRVFSNGTICYGPWSNVMSQPESGSLTLEGLSAVNLSAGQDISGGYVGDVFSWSATVSGGSGSYTFKYSLVSLSGGSPIVLKDFSDGYTSLPAGKTSMTTTFTLTLTENYINLINSQKYAMQMEVRDSLGATTAMYAAPATLNEMNFVAPAPVSKVVNKTIRVGENFTLDHGIYTEAGDVANIEIANTNSAISLRDNVITGVNNGYATLLITSKRYPDILIVYNITVGYAPLTIASVQPSASKLNNYETLAWDITFAGGRPNYNVNFKVYRGTTVVVNSNRTETATGRISVNYQPTVAGTYLLEVTITSADGQSITQRSSATVVSNYTPVTVVPSTTASVTNRNLTWTTAYKGTSSVIRRDYTLFRDGSVVATEVGLNNLTFNYTPTVAGSYILRVIVYEANGNKIEVTAPTITVTQGGSGTSGTGTVTGVRVALRRGASTKYGIILRVDKGETVTILERSGSWYYVSYKGTTGWMMAQYVKAN